MKKIIVVGSGFSGAVLARKIAEESNRKVEVIERRTHIGGNMYDSKDEYGILIQRYGPHFFNTNDYTLIEFLSQYAEMFPFAVKGRSVIDGEYITLPYNFMTVRELMGERKAQKIYAELRSQFPGRDRIPLLELLENNDTDISEFANKLFDKAYKTYVSKMWDTPVDKIDRYVLDRVPFRLGYDERYLVPDFQYLPKNGFTEIFENLLNHPNITVSLNTDALPHISFSGDEPLSCGKACWDGEELDALIYTGNIDELFKHKFGNLPYRSLEFEYNHYKQERRLPGDIVYYPQAEGFTRDTEYRRFMYDDSECRGTTIVTETPLWFDVSKLGEATGGGIPYYPVVTAESSTIYEKYLSLSKTCENLFLCGRLAEFKYYNMDVCLEHALSYFHEVKKYLES